MTKLTFDEPSEAEISASAPALKVKNTGQGDAVAFWGETTQYGTGAVIGVCSGGDSVGILGKTTGAQSAGVKGESTGGDSVGVLGKTTGANSAGVKGESTGSNSAGVYGISDSHIGTQGESKTGAGVYGHSTSSVGVYAGSTEKIGIFAEGKEAAGWFQGNVEVTGDIKLVNADCAEDFDIVEENVEAGTVMVLNENGSLQQSYQEYDKKVAGIVSGASGYKPAIVLDRQNPENQKDKERLPIALVGKVYCKVDARHSPIEIGDLLTTSSTKGYAMKAEDPMKAFGAVIGKALSSIKDGIGMIPILVALQ